MSSLSKRSIISSCGIIFIAICVLILYVSPAGLHAAEKKRGGTLTYSFHPEPIALCTIATTALPVAIMSTKIFESLLEYEGPALKPKPGLAESWTISDDKMTYTFKLRAGVKWHDGTPFTSEDVKFSILNIVKPLHSRGRVYFGLLDKLETPDALTVVFKLKAPVPFFIKAFQPGESPILPKHIVQAENLSSKKTFRASPFMRNPVGTGAWRLKEWKKGSHIILERNPDYWKKGFPLMDRIVLRLIPDGVARSIALENGEIDLVPMTGLPPSEYPRLAKLDHLEMDDNGSEGLGPIMWLEINLRKKPLSDVRVRKAMSMAIDRKIIADIIWFGLGVPARTAVVHQNPFSDKKLPAFEFNIDKANKMLDEAGYPRDADGVRFKITQNVLPYGEAWSRMAEYTQQALGKIGIEIKTQNLDFGAWIKKIYTDWDFSYTSMFVHNYSDPAIGVQRAFISSNIKRGASFTNSMGYRNPRVDELFKAGNVETDPAKRRQIYNEIQVILHDELPCIFLLDWAYMNVWNKRVQGLITNGISMYSNWDSVWLK